MQRPEASSFLRPSRGIAAPSTSVVMVEPLSRPARQEIQDVREQYADLVKLQMSGSRFLSDERERALLEDGLTRYGLSLDQARGMVRGTAEERGTTLQRDVDEAAAYMLRDAAEDSGRVRRRDFERVVGFYTLRSEGTLPVAEIARRVKALMEQNKLRPRRAGLLLSRRWYSKIK